MERILTRNVGIKDACELPVARERGAYAGLAKALAMAPEAVIDEVKRSQLRGRGGAGFPAGRKWEMARQQLDEPKYLVANADEGEPGTFKDRVILANDPHLLLEGMIISAYAFGAEKGFVYIRGEYHREIRILRHAIGQAREAGLLGGNILDSGFSFDVQIYVGAGAYICGDETALFNSMQGERPNPREKPPFPAQAGFLHKPTVINNVETLSNIPFILDRGADWYLKIGPERSKGPKLFCVSGHVNKPGVYETPMGVTLRYLIEKHAGGMKGGKFKAALPGGLASCFVRSQDVRLDFESLSASGSMMGSGGVIVLNEHTDMADVACNAIKYFVEESCGQCTPCREGTRRAQAILERLLAGRSRESDLDLLIKLGEIMSMTSRCGLGQSALNAVASAIRLFREDFVQHIERTEVLA